MKILVVDDESVQVETIARGLRLFGHEVVTATSYAQAMEALAETNGQAVQAIIADLTMPGKSGYHLIQQARQKIPSIGVIIITGLTDHPELEAARNQGITVLQKPFDPFTLDTAIHNLGG